MNGEDSGSTAPKSTDVADSVRATVGVTARLTSSKLARPLPSTCSRTVIDVVVDCVTNVVE